MSVATSRTFRSGNSQALRLPKDVAFEGEVEVTIVRSGDVLTVYPKRASPKALAKRLLDMPGPSEVQARDSDIFPKRPGL